MQRVSVGIVETSGEVRLANGRGLHKIKWLERLFSHISFLLV
jgi:hypothetical protein